MPRQRRSETSRPLVQIFPDAPHIDRGVLAWLAELDPFGDRAWHERALRAVAIAAWPHRRFGREDAVQECLVWIHLHPEAFRGHSGKGRDRGYLVGLFRNVIVDAVRRERGDRRVTDPETGRRVRVYDPRPWPVSNLGHRSDESDDDVLDRRAARTVTPSAEDVALSAPAEPQLEVGGVSDRDLELLRLRFGEGWTSRELAEEYGTSPDAVRRRVSRARAVVFRAPPERG